MKISLLVGFFILFNACKNNNSEISINISEEKLIDRIPAPEGYEWISEDSGSFGEFLQHSKLKKDGSKILDFKNKPIRNQSEHIAILDYDIGNKDLQQCADAIIRLRAEYLYNQRRFDDIEFHFTSGDIFSWNDFKIGLRPQLKSDNEVVFKNVADKEESYKSFREYLDVIFMYAGTISLHNETNEISDNKKIRTGDFLITPGSPGHAVIIVGRAKNKEGEIVYLLAQGYTPAQSIHVITNPYDRKINPWYRLDVSKSPTLTAGYAFKKTNIRTFND